MTDEYLLKCYMRGFSDELDSPKHENRIISIFALANKAYNMGRRDAFIGDDARSSDNKTDKEILTQIKKL